MPEPQGTMRQQMLDHAFLALLLLSQLLWHASEGNCSKDNYVINVMVLNSTDYPVTSANIVPTVKLGLELVEYILKGNNVSVKATYDGFNTSFYVSPSCRTSTCEGVDLIRKLYDESKLGCTILGPTCTFATYQMVSEDNIVRLPLISAGTFGISCDFKERLTRMLTPARKVSYFLIEFWSKLILPFKTFTWETTYFYKNNVLTEDCYWYMNALDAPNTDFSDKINFSEILKSSIQLQNTVQNSSRKSNVIITCGTPDDIKNALENSKVDKDIVIILIDLHSNTYNENSASGDHMKNVLVLTLAPTNYSAISNYSGFPLDPEMFKLLKDDFLTGYLDAVLLFGHALKNIHFKPGLINSSDFIDQFRNVTFPGILGPVTLDKFGDIDVCFTILYTTEKLEVSTIIRPNRTSR